MIKDLCGAPGTRRGMWTEIANQFQFGFTQNQLNVLNGFHQNTILDMMAGCGKTKLLLAVLYRLYNHADKPLIFWATATNALAYDNYNTVCTFVEPKECLLLSIQDTGSTLHDHGQAFLDHLVDDFFAKELPQLQALDHVLHLLKDLLVQARKMPEIRKLEIKELLHVMTFLLAERHLLLHTEFYAQVKEYQTKATKKVRVIITTVDNLVNFFSNESSWSKYFKKERTRFGLLDD